MLCERISRDLKDVEINDCKTNIREWGPVIQAWASRVAPPSLNNQRRACVSSGSVLGIPRRLSGKESSCQCRRRRFNPWVRKFPGEGDDNPHHSSTVAWEIPWAEQPGGLQSMGSQRVRHNLATKQQVLGIQWQIKQAPCPSGANSTTRDRQMSRLFQCSVTDTVRSENMVLSEQVRTIASQIQKLNFTGLPRIN